MSFYTGEEENAAELQFGKHFFNQDVNEQCITTDEVCLCLMTRSDTNAKTEYEFSIVFVILELSILLYLVCLTKREIILRRWRSVNKRKN